MNYFRRSAVRVVILNADSLFICSFHALSYKNAQYSFMCQLTLDARSNSGVTLGRFRSISLMRVLPDGWVDSH